MLMNLIRLKLSAKLKAKTVQSATFDINEIEDTFIGLAHYTDKDGKPQTDKSQRKASEGEVFRTLAESKLRKLIKYDKIDRVLLVLDWENKIYSVSVYYVKNNEKLKYSSTL